MSTKLPTNSLSFRLAGPEAVTPERSLAFFRENRDFFARWDPPRPPVFYTPERQRQYLLEEAAENAAGTALAFAAADMALAGISSRIPADECIEAMREVGESIPCSLRETAGGCLAATPTGKRLREQVYGPEK